MICNACKTDSLAVEKRLGQCQILALGRRDTSTGIENLKFKKFDDLDPPRIHCQCKLLGFNVRDV
jgi:hypothetical protein